MNDPHPPLLCGILHYNSLNDVFRDSRKPEGPSSLQQAGSKFPAVRDTPSVRPEQRRDCALEPHPIQLTDFYYPLHFHEPFLPKSESPGYLAERNLFESIAQFTRHPFIIRLGASAVHLEAPDWRQMSSTDREDLALGYEEMISWSYPVPYDNRGELCQSNEFNLRTDPSPSGSCPSNSA